MPTRTANSIVEFLVEEPRLTEYKMPPIERQLDLLAAQVGQGILRLDFQRVEHLTSMVLGKLVSLHKRIKHAGGSLQIVNLNANVYELFQITRLDAILNVRPSAAPDADGSIAAKSA